MQVKCRGQKSSKGMVGVNFLPISNPGYGGEWGVELGKLEGEKWKDDKYTEMKNSINHLEMIRGPADNKNKMKWKLWETFLDKR